MLRYAAKRAANCSRSTHQQYKSLHLWPAKPLVEAAVYDLHHIPKPCVAGSNPAGGTYSIYKHVVGRLTLVRGLCVVLGGQAVGRVGDGGQVVGGQSDGDGGVVAVFV